MFRTLVNAMARPGTVQPTEVTPVDHGVLATLVDQEISLWTEDETVRQAFRNASRYEPAPLDEAAIVHISSSVEPQLEELDQGTNGYPDRSATVVHCVDELTGSRGGPGTEIAVSGPGVPSTRTVGISGVTPETIRNVASTQSEYPRGIDYIFTAPNGVMGLPRSVDVEVI